MRLSTMIIFALPLLVVASPLGSRELGGLVRRTPPNHQEPQVLDTESTVGDIVETEVPSIEPMTDRDRAKKLEEDVRQLNTKYSKALKAALEAQRQCKTLRQHIEKAGKTPDPADLEALEAAEIEAKKSSDAYEKTDQECKAANVELNAISDRLDGPPSSLRQPQPGRRKRRILSGVRKKFRSWTGKGTKTDAPSQGKFGTYKLLSWGVNFKSPVEDLNQS